MITFAVTGYVASGGSWSDGFSAGRGTASTRISAVLSSPSASPALILATADADRFGSNLSFFDGVPEYPPTTSLEDGKLVFETFASDWMSASHTLRIVRVQWGTGKETTLLEIVTMRDLLGQSSGFAEFSPEYTYFHIGGDFIDLPDESYASYYYGAERYIGMRGFLRANQTEYLPVGPGATVAEVAFDPSLFLWQAAGAITEGDDTLTGSEADEQLWGLGGHDVLDGGAGNDTLRGGPGWDTLIGGEGDDVLHGDSWGNRLLGGPGNDTISAGGDRSTVFSDEGDDGCRKRRTAADTSEFGISC